MKSLTFSLEPAAPFRLDLTVWALRRWPNNRIDHWDGDRYRRVLVLAGQPVGVMVAQPGPPSEPRLQVTLWGEAATSALIADAAQVLARSLNIFCDLNGFYEFAAADPKLGSLAKRFRGLKPPRFPTLFECLVNAIACQQVTLTFGIRLLNSLAEAYGPTFADGDEKVLGLPQADTLAGVPIEDLRALHFSRQKARALTELARAVAGGELDLEVMDGWDETRLRRRLRQLWGVGRWTTEYALLRGLGRLNVFPGDDVGARNGLARWLGLSEKLDYDGVRRSLERWQPYAGLIYFHLLLKRHAREGNLQTVQG